ncbi:MAG: DNA-directed RNA polymerase subunit omega [Thermoguttaceae bacterium]|jgi:DNA-directed RNA polymerase subunit omega
MFEELKDDELIEKVGGRFKLTVLIQKRLAVLNRGSAPVSDAGIDFSASRDPADLGYQMQTVIREILEDKISLAPNDNLINNDHTDFFNS